MTTARSERAVRALARECGVQLAYDDIEGRRRHARTDAVLAVLVALGIVDGVADVDDARRRRHADRTDAIVAPLIVAWDGVCPLTLWVPRADARLIASHKTSEAAPRASASVAASR